MERCWILQNVNDHTKNTPRIRRRRPGVRYSCSCMNNNNNDDDGCCCCDYYYYDSNDQNPRRKRPRNNNIASKIGSTDFGMIRMWSLLVVVMVWWMVLWFDDPITSTVRLQLPTLVVVSSFSLLVVRPQSTVVCGHHTNNIMDRYLPSSISCVSITDSIRTTLLRLPSTSDICQTPRPKRMIRFSSPSSSSSSSSLYDVTTELPNDTDPIDDASSTFIVNDTKNITTTAPSKSPSLLKPKNGTNHSSSSNSKNPPSRPRRVIPPTEIELQQLKQIRQEAYEKICGPSSPITYDNDDDDDDDDSNTTVLIDTGATYNATKEFILDTTASTDSTSTSSSSSFSTFTLPTPNITSVILPTTVTNTSILDNVYVQLNTTTTTANTTNIAVSTSQSHETMLLLQVPSSLIHKKKKSKPASIWSFESLFPEPVLDTESIQNDLFRNLNRTATTSSSHNTTTTVAISQTIPSIDTNAKPSQPDTFLYGGSGVIRKEKKPSPLSKQQQQQQPVNQELNDMKDTTMAATNSSSTFSSNMNSTGKVDPLLTRMVEDRVYGYRRLPTGALQYETSLIGPDNAIQFRNGVRLGNPLPINADILSYMAKKELQRGRVEEACELYEKAVSIDPADGRAYLGLSKCAERRRDFALARKWLVQGINRSVSVQQLQSAAVQQQQQQRSGTSSSPSSNKNNKNRNESDEKYTETTTLVPDRGANPYLLQALGCLEEKLGRLTQAETLFAEAVKSRPYHTAAWVSLAVLRTRKLGYPVRVGRECFQCAERELQIAQQAPSSYIYTSWANLEYHKANDKNRARELFQKAIQIDPQCSAAWLQLGVLEAACENWDAAELCFDTVLKFDQRNTRVLQAYAIMETKRPSGDSRKAIGLFERAVQTNPRDAGVYQPYALYVAELGDMNMARSLLQKGTQANKRHAATWQAWGVLETRFGDADTARKIFQEGIWACGQLSGSQSGGYHCDRLWQAWGVLEANEKEYAAARRCFSRALDANNRNVPAFTAWALMEEQLGNVKDARMIFERGLRKFSTGSEEKKALYRSYELMEQRLGDTTAAQNIYQRSVRESFNEKDDIDILKTNSVINTRGTGDETYSDVAISSQQPQTTIAKKKTKEFEVVRWENTGGEVWLNDRAIEAKVSITNKKLKSSRDGTNKDKK